MVPFRSVPAPKPGPRRVRASGSGSGVGFGFRFGFAHGVRPVRPSVVDPYKDFARQTLEEHPRLRATRLFEMLRDRGYAGSVVQLRRYLVTIRPTARAEAYLRLETLPGEQAQVDWGHFGKIRVGKALRPLSCFVMVLGWSRAMYARFTLDQTLESFLSSHVLGFEALGGVPRAILYDNLKSVVLERQGDHVRFHPRLLDFAGHYHFAPNPCAPYRGNEKGKVERTIQYLRHAFFAARRFSGPDDLNGQLAAWIERVAHARPVPGDPDKRLVRDALTDERPRLLPLPAHRFECDLVRTVSSGKQPYVRFDLNDYSIPHDRVRMPLTLVASETDVRLVDAVGAELARHARSYDRGAVIEEQAHLAALARHKRRAHDLRGRDRLRSVCPAADGFIDALARRGEPLAGHTTRLGQLLDRYGAGDLDAAITDALARGAISAASVAHILDQRARKKSAPPPLDVVLPDDPRVRDLRVTPHALGPYDALANPDDRRTPMHPLAEQLIAMGLRSVAAQLDDLIALATKKRWGATEILEHVAALEAKDRAKRSLDRRLSRSKLGRFKSMADYDWSWPKRIDRAGVEAALRLEFLERTGNLVLVAPQGLGKTMIAQNIAHQAIQAGHSVLFVTAAQMLLDLAAQDSARALDRRIRHYNRATLLVVDEIGYLSYDNRNADLFFQVVSRRYEQKSLVLTTNLAFSDWPTVFPNATSATALIDRLVHHADVLAIEGESYRRREAESDKKTRRRPSAKSAA